MYTVTWAERALDKLADFYIAASPDERQRMASGVEALNRRLAMNPMDVGESREEDARLTFVPLLTVRFRVDLMADTVFVVAIDRTRR